MERILRAAYKAVYILIGATLQIAGIITILVVGFLAPVDHPSTTLLLALGVAAAAGSYVMGFYPILER